MSDLANALALPRTFVFEGRELAVPARDVECVGLFEVHVEGEALKLVERHAGRMSPAAYQAQLDGWRRDGPLGVYDFDGPFASATRAGGAGAKEWAYLVLRKGNPDAKPPVDRHLIDRLFTDAAALAAYHAAYAAANRPNPAGPAAAAPSGP